MHFRLANVPVTFERLVEYFLAGLPVSTALVYLDDVLIMMAERIFADQIANLIAVLQRFERLI